MAQVMTLFGSVEVWPLIDMYTSLMSTVSRFLVTSLVKFCLRRIVKQSAPVTQQKASSVKTIPVLQTPNA